MLFINFAIRLVLITANIFLLVMGLFWEIEYFTLINLAVILIIQLFFLIRKFNVLNRKLLIFFESIKSDDSGFIFQKETGSRNLDAIYRNFGDINRKINELKIENIRSNLHYQKLVEHVNTGIIQFDDNGNVDLINDHKARIHKNYKRIEQVYKHVLIPGSKATEAKKETTGWKTDFQRLKLAKDLAVDIDKGTGVFSEHQKVSGKVEILADKRSQMQARLEASRQFGIVEHGDVEVIEDGSDNVNKPQIEAKQGKNTDTASPPDDDN